MIYLYLNQQLMSEPMIVGESYVANTKWYLSLFFIFKLDFSVVESVGKLGGEWRSLAYWPLVVMF